MADALSCCENTCGHLQMVTLRSRKQERRDLEHGCGNPTFWSHRQLRQRLCLSDKSQAPTLSAENMLLHVQDCADTLDTSFETHPDGCHGGDPCRHWLDAQLSAERRAEV